MTGQGPRTPRNAGPARDLSRRRRDPGHSPNILIVMTDHQRADTVLPEHPAITPHVARLGKEGVIFTHTFCPTPHCCPARATFFTGLYPSGHGVWNHICNDQADNTLVIYTSDHGDYGGETMIQTDRWRMSVTREGDPYLLFGLESDPDEQRNRVADPSLEPVRTDLSLRIFRRMHSAQLMLDRGAKGGKKEEK